MSSSSPIDLSQLKDKSCLITGGASGLGFAVAEAFARAGAYVTIADLISTEPGEKIAKDLAGNSLQVSYIHCDVTSWESQVKAFKTAVKFSPSQSLDLVAMFAGTAIESENIVEQVSGMEASLDKDPGPPCTMALDVNLTGSIISQHI